MKNLKIGHTTITASGTGVSVFLFEETAAGGYRIAGSAPATLEIITLDPDSSAWEMHGLVLTGGSAFGLYSAKGVMQYLSEKGIGHAVPHGVVPIVPAAAIYDLAYKSLAVPSAEDAYNACLKATEDNTETGRIGAGTGATVGKLITSAHPMNGGLGRAELKLRDGIEVIAYAVVNSVGDVRDQEGHIIAGARNADGQFANCENNVLKAASATDFLETSNTTLIAVFTNARFNKNELGRIAKMATAGMARAISPIFTIYDGDIVFCVSVGNLPATEITIGTAAAQVVQQAILNAVKDSEVIL